MKKENNRFRKDPDAAEDWRQEEKGMTEDEMVGWYHRLDEHEFEQALGDGEGQGSLACWSMVSQRVVHGVAKNQIQLSDWTTTTCGKVKRQSFLYYGDLFLQEITASHSHMDWEAKEKKKEKKQSSVSFQLYDWIIGHKFWIPTHFNKTTDN